MGFLWYAGAFVIAIGILVTVHESGHYLAARLCKVRVLRFSFGFGRPLIRWQRPGAETEWTICAIPLGGYVKMLDESEGDVSAQDVERAFNRKSVWQRLFIVSAGPAANLLLAVLIYWIGFVQGVSEPRPILGEPTPNSAVARASLRAGDEILMVGERATRTWADVRWGFVQAMAGQPQVELLIRSGSNDRRVTFSTPSLSDISDESDPLKELGFNSFRPEFPPLVGTVVAGGAAERAGIRVGDLVLSVDRQPVKHWGELVQIISAAPDRSLRLELSRAGQRLALDVIPEKHTQGGQTIGRIGVGVEASGPWRERLFVEIRYGALDAFGHAIVKTWEMAGFSLRMLGRMIVGEVSLKNISGPLTIADYAGQSAKVGLDAYIRFLALISISIGVLNLLPIPLLDGGHIMYYLAEIAFRRPLSQRTMELGQQIGFVLLACLMAFAFFNDITRLLS